MPKEELTPIIPHAAPHPGPDGYWVFIALDPRTKKSMGDVMKAHMWVINRAKHLTGQHAFSSGGMAVVFLSAN